MALIQTALLRLGSHYSNNRPTEEAIKIIAEDWFMDFSQAKISPELFSRAVVLARRRCKFFPVETEMLDLVKELREMDARKRVLIPEFTGEQITDEDARKNLERLRHMITLCGSGKTPEECEKEMSEFIKKQESAKNTLGFDFQDDATKKEDKDHPETVHRE